MPTWKLVSLLLIALALSACSADEPKFSLAARPADPKQLAQFDIASFAGATVAYPALATGQQAQREFQIPVGDYLMSRLSDVLTPTPTKGLVSLASFSGRCAQAYPVAPHVLCDATLEVLVDGGKQRVTLSQADLGNAHLIHGPYQGAGVQPYIEKQVAILIDQLVEPLR